MVKRRVKPSNKTKSTIFAVIFSVIGIALMSFGTFTGVANISSAQNDKRLLSEGISTVGEIVDVQFDIRHGRGSSSQKIFTVEYTDSTGKIQSLTEDELYRTREEGSIEHVSNEWIHKKVKVFYDTANTSDAVVEGWADSTSMAVVGFAFLELVGSGLIAFGVLELRRGGILSRKPKLKA